MPCAYRGMKQDNGATSAGKVRAYQRRSATDSRNRTRSSVCR
jgi:hypothetical protein